MPHRTTSHVSYAQTTLPFPVFAADFDPYNRGYLVVGGGGGESKTGVPNQIALLDVSDRASLTTAAEIQLSRDEDSVQSVANLATKDGLIVFAGVNSSQADQNAGRNQHFRSFQITYPPRKKQKTEKDNAGNQGEVKAIGKRDLFRAAKSAKSETYQRLLRLSPAHKRDTGAKRIGAIATGMAKNCQIVLFDATSATPEDADVIARIELDEGIEVADLDIAETEESTFSLAYCTDYDIYEQTYHYDFASKKVEKIPNGPRRIHQAPFPNAKQSTGARAKYRSLRFLNGHNIVALANKPLKSGAELQVVHLYPTGPAALVLQKTLPVHVRQAVAMDVCALDADEGGNHQVVVALAAQDISIEVYTTEYRAGTDTFSRFQHYLQMQNVHQHQMTKICFSRFHSAAPPDDDKADSKAESAVAPASQYIQLASVSYGNTVVVDTFPLSPLDPKYKRSRHVLRSNGDRQFTQYSLIALASLIVLVIAYMIQYFTNGFTSDKIGPFHLSQRDVRDFYEQPISAAHDMQRSVSSVIDSALPSSFPAKGRLQDLLTHHLGTSEQQTKALIIRDAEDGTGVSVDVHPDREAYLKHDTQAKRWEELDEQKRATWRKKLVDAGRWAESEGEKVLVGLLFSEYAGVVGQVAAAAAAANG